jgi:hypothetical protein
MRWLAIREWRTAKRHASVQNRNCGGARAASASIRPADDALGLRGASPARSPPVRIGESRRLGQSALSLRASDDDGIRLGSDPARAGRGAPGRGLRPAADRAPLPSGSSWAGVQSFGCRRNRSSRPSMTSKADERAIVWVPRTRGCHVGSTEPIGVSRYSRGVRRSTRLSVMA